MLSWCHVRFCIASASASSEEYQHASAFVNGRMVVGDDEQHTLLGLHEAHVPDCLLQAELQE